MRADVVMGVVMLLTAAPALAECRLALLLAVDVSSSVDDREDALQRGGLADALRAPEVVAAFFASDFPVALAAYEWSGRYHQDVLLDWTIIEAPEDLRFAADQIAQSTRGFREFATAMGHALEFGGEMMARAPTCLSQTLDMAGDGLSNEGIAPEVAYAAPAYQRITVNGLVVDAGAVLGREALLGFYQGEVLHGPGAFLIVADGFEDYTRAMREKLERELRPAVIGAVPAERPDAG